MSGEQPAFEKDLARLEEIVETLEEGGLSLDESLKRFEEGIQLAKRCEKALAAAEKKIEQLTKTPEGTLEAEPFGETGDTDEAERLAASAGAGESGANAPEGNAAPSPKDGEGGKDEDEGYLF